MDEPYQKSKTDSIQMPMQCALPARGNRSARQKTAFDSFGTDDNTPTNSVTTIPSLRGNLRTLQFSASSVTAVETRYKKTEHETISTFQACRQATRQAWIAWISCDFAGVLLGYDCFYINGVLGMDKFKQDFGRPSTNIESVDGFLYSNLQKAVVVSIFALGVARKFTHKIRIRY